MFHIFTFIYLFILHGYITNSQYDQLPVGLIAQLVEHCIGIARVMGPNTVQACKFFSALTLELPTFLTLQRAKDLITHFTATFRIFHLQFTPYIHFVYSQSSLQLTIKTQKHKRDTKSELTGVACGLKMSVLFCSQAKER